MAVIDALMGGNYGESLIADASQWGVTAGNWTAASHDDDLISALRNVLRFHWVAERNPEKALIIRRAVDVDTCAASGRFGILIGFQGAESIGGRFFALEVFARLGLRVLGILYNERNLLGDGCLEPENRGLTSFGRQIVRDCNRLGLIIDLSHSGERTSLDAIALSSQPCIFSHSNPYATHANPRNVTDQQMLAAAEGGGVVCLSAWSNFVGPTGPDHHPGREDLVAQIQYAVELVGIDHVGVGSDIYRDLSHAVDWENSTKRRYPEQTGAMRAEQHNIKGYADYNAIFALGTDLETAGYSASDVAKVLGNNVHRVMREVLPK
jgi:membrane dipeptidase